MSQNRNEVENLNTLNNWNKMKNNKEEDFNFLSLLDEPKKKDFDLNFAKSEKVKITQKVTNLEKEEDFRSQLKKKNNENISFKSFSMNSAWNQNFNNKTLKNNNFEKRRIPYIATTKLHTKKNDKKIIKNNLEKDDLINYLEQDLENLKDYKSDLENCITWKKNDILINCENFTNEINKNFRFLEDYPDIFIPKLKKLLQTLFPLNFLPPKKNLFKKIKQIKENKKKISKLNTISKKENFPNLETQPKKLKDHYNKMEIRLYYWNSLNSKDYLNRDIDQFLTIEGFVIYISPQKVLVTSMKFKCSQCGLNISIQFEKFIIKYPEKCESCFNNQFFPLKTTSEVILMQRVKIQQIGEEQEIAMLELKGNLVNSVEVGDEVVCNGILRSEILNKDDFLGKQQNKTGGLFMYFIEVNSLLKKKEKILQKKEQLEILSNTNILTSQVLFNNQNNLFFKTYEKGLYFLEIHEDQLKIFNQIIEEELVFETLIAFFCPKIKSSFLLKAFIILSLILQEDPIHLLIIGNPGSNKSELLNFASEVAHKNIPNLSLNLFPTLEKISGFEKSINPGILALGHEGICVFDHIDKLKKRDIEKFPFLMEDKKVSVPKLFEKSFLKANTTILGGVECFQEIENNFESIKNNLKLPKKVIENFDFILIAKKKQKKYIKNLSTKLFQKSQIMSQINQEDIKKKGFSIYIKKKIQEFSIKNRFTILKDKKVYKKFQMYIQNLYKPILTTGIGNYLNEYYFETKERFNLKNGEINPKFFLSIIKLVFARTILNCKSSITIQDCDEIIEMLNENFQNLYPFNNGNFVCKMNTNGKANKDLSKTKKEKLFMEKLKEICIKEDKNIFLYRELKDFEEYLNLQIQDFEGLIYKLNNMGFLLKKNSKEYEIHL